MGTRGNSQNLPFGYDPSEIQGLGLPSYLPPRPGQPLLNNQEEEHIHDFFSAFEQDQAFQNNSIMSQYPDHMGQIQQIPQEYIGHQTSLQSPHMTFSPHQNQYQFNMSQQQAMNGFNNGQMTSPINQNFAANQQFASQWQQYPVQHMPGINYDTDPSFMGNGFNDGQEEYNPHEMSMTARYGMVDHNSAEGSGPHTQPSSPVTRKRTYSQSLGSGGNHVLTANRTKRQSFTNPQLHTPISRTMRSEGSEQDADYDEDAPHDGDREASPPAPWPSGKARPPYKAPPPPKPKKQKAGTPRTSSISAARPPLTAQQKKSNHTNSEQRRRDATARSYAELYDLVPEIQEMGKQSTMRKLEIVVEKVQNIKHRLERLRELTGRDRATGKPLHGGGAGLAIHTPALSQQMPGQIPGFLPPQNPLGMGAGMSQVRDWQ